MQKIHLLKILFFALLCIYALFSYSLTHPSLVLTSVSVYWTFQTWMWHTFYNNRLLLTEVYGVLVVLLFVAYGLIAKQTSSKRDAFQNMNVPKIFFGFFLFMLPLLFSYNSLSSDMFNYIFNAKMVLVYHVNPHFIQAKMFAFDPMTRFMTNTYGLAPYGYGWTAISLVPYALGLGKFVPTWIIFRLFSVLSLFLLMYSMKELARTLKVEVSQRDLFLIFGNPLLLVEIISNAHNDIWMMWSALLAFSLVGKQKLKWWQFVASLALMIFSVSMKFSTLLLVPLWIVILLQYALPFLQKKKSGLFQLFDKHWPLLASLVMFLPLLTLRSRQFYPWYLTWVLVWLPFVRVKVWKWSIFALSFFALMRYIPWLLTDSYQNGVEWQQKAMTWIPFVVTLCVLSLFYVVKWQKRKTLPHFHTRGV